MQIGSNLIHHKKVQANTKNILHQREQRLDSEIDRKLDPTMQITSSKKIKNVPTKSSTHFNMHTDSSNLYESILHLMDKVSWVPVNYLSNFSTVGFLSMEAYELHKTRKKIDKLDKIKCSLLSQSDFEKFKKIGMESKKINNKSDFSQEFLYVEVLRDRRNELSDELAKRGHLQVKDLNEYCKLNLLDIALKLKKLQQNHLKDVKFYLGLDLISGAGWGAMYLGFPMMSSSISAVQTLLGIGSGMKGLLETQLFKRADTNNNNFLLQKLMKTPKKSMHIKNKIEIVTNQIVLLNEQLEKIYGSVHSYEKEMFKEILKICNIQENQFKYAKFEKETQKNMISIALKSTLT